MIKAPIVPPEILAEVERHAFGTIRPNRESVGRLVIKDGVAIRYERFRNWAKGDHTFRVRHTANRIPDDADMVVLVHSHPGGYRYPSEGDLKGANSVWLNRPYAIFVKKRKYGWFKPGSGNEETGELLFYCLHYDRKNYHELPQEDQ